ncbi:MAG: hypothetical protein ACK5YR_20020, partial [Pirellula sp.]
MDRDSLTTERAQRIDRIAARSKQTFAPTNDIEQFQALSPSRTAIQSRLLGSSMIPQPAWSTEGNVDTSTSVPVDTTDAERIATGSMIRSLFASLTSSSPSNSTQSFSERSVATSTKEWFGAFCTIDGHVQFVENSGLSGGMAPWYVPEGEAPDEGDDGIVPSFEIPELQSVSHAGSYSTFSPATAGNSNSIVTFGSFTPAAAGVKWSVSSSFSDSINVAFAASGNATFSPTQNGGATNGGTTGGGDSGPSGGGGVGPGSGPGDSPDGPNGSESDYPEDFNAESNWNASTALSVQNHGSFSISVTPSTTFGGGTRKAITATMSYGANGVGAASADWASTSSSGSVSLVNQTPGVCIICMMSGGDSSGFGSETPSDWYSENPSEETDITIEPSPVGPIEGTGHSASSSGNATSLGAGNTSGSFLLSALFDNDELVTLGGETTNSASGTAADTASGAHDFVFRDQFVTTLPNGISTTTIEYVSGWSGDGGANGLSEGDSDLDFGVTTSGTPQATGALIGKVNGDGQANAGDMHYIRYHVVGSESLDAIASAPGVNSSTIGSRDGEILIVYRSQNGGDLIGDADGDASNGSSSADIESDVDGKANSLLIRLETIDWIAQSIIHDMTGTTTISNEEHYTAVVISKGKFQLDGNIGAARTNNGPISFSIDAEATDRLDLEYRSLWTVFYSKDHSTLGGMGGYDYVRRASMSAFRDNQSDTNGSVSLGLLPQDDIGSFNGSGSYSFSKGHLQIDVVGMHDGGAMLPSPFEEELLGLFVKVEPDPGEGSSGPPTNGSGGGGGNSGGGSVAWAAVKGGLAGLVQGACNIVNGVQDAAVGAANLAIAIPNTVAGGIDYVTGVTDPNYQMRISYLNSPDWSRNLVTEESGTPGGWDDMHGWSKFAGGEGVMALLTGGVTKAATAVDDAGRCANRVARFVFGECFVAGTPVTISQLPFSESRERSLWTNSSWLEDEPIVDFLLSRSALEISEVVDGAGSASAKVRSVNSNFVDYDPRFFVPIENVPLGARVPSKNPKRWEYDTQFPEPNEKSWKRFCIQAYDKDGTLVEAEFIRPEWWMEKNQIAVGATIPMVLAELGLSGLAIVTSIEECGAIARGDGSVVTGRFT